MSKTKQNLHHSFSKDIFKIELTEKGKESNILESPLLVSLVYPIIVALITAWITNYFANRKNRKSIEELKSANENLKSQTDLNKANIEKVKASFQPTVVSSLQIIQNNIFNQKLNTFDKLIAIESGLFNISPRYVEGIIIEEDYYTCVYENFNLNTYNNIRDFRRTSHLFPDNITEEFNEMFKLFKKLENIQNEQISLKDLQLTKDIEDILIKIKSTFELLINLIKNDLHLNNTFIHEFVETYNKID